MVWRAVRCTMLSERCMKLALHNSHHFTFPRQLQACKKHTQGFTTVCLPLLGSLVLDLPKLMCAAVQIAHCGDGILCAVPGAAVASQAAKLCQLHFLMAGHHAHAGESLMFLHINLADSSE